MIAFPTALSIFLTAVTAAGPGEAEPLRIPLVPGLVLVTAVEHEGVGDYESILTVTDVGSDAVVARLDTERDQAGAKGALTHVSFSVERTVLAADLATARAHEPWFSGEPGRLARERFPGVTAWCLSRDVLVDLRERGQATLSLSRTAPEDIDAEGEANLKKLGMTAAQIDDMRAMKRRLAPRLTRVGTLPERVPLLVNGRRVTADAWHARVTFDGRESELWVLDDPEHAVVLRFHWSKGQRAAVVGGRAESRGAVVRVEIPGAGDIVKDLSESGRLALEGIYFDFGSAALKASSEPALDRVAAALRAVQGAFEVSGHTDDVGLDATNQILSERRAQTVRDALVARGVDARRLTARGYGAARPLEPNSTLEGRARNRRVELVRAP